MLHGPWYLEHGGAIGLGFRRVRVYYMSAKHDKVGKKKKAKGRLREFVFCMSSLELTPLTTMGKCDVGYSNISVIGLLKSPLNYANFICFL
jgi:hypothetical protein